MNRAAGLCIPFFLVLALQAQVAQRAPKSDPWAQLPSNSLDFAHAFPLTALPASPFLVDPVQCSPNGQLFLQIPLPPTYMRRAFASITKQGKTTLNSNGGQIAGFDELRQIAYFPRDKHFYALMEGRRHVQEQPMGLTPPKSPWQELIAAFGDDGTFESMTALEISFVPLRFAVFPSGRYVILGQESINQSPVLITLDKDGTNPHPIDLFGSGLYGKERLRQYFPNAANDDSIGSGMSQVLGSVQFVSHGDNILLVQAGTNFPLVEIGDAGILRNVRLGLPTGVIIQSVFPSSGSLLYVQVTDHRTKPETSALVAFDPDSGDALRRIAITGLLTLRSVACEADGTFLGLKKVFEKNSDKGTWNLVTAAE
jgi:hypothetical protein